MIKAWLTEVTCGWRLTDKNRKPWNSLYTVMIVAQRMCRCIGAQGRFRFPQNRVAYIGVLFVNRNVEQGKVDV